MRNQVQLVWMLVTLILALMAIWPLLYMLATAFKPTAQWLESGDNAQQRRLPATRGANQCQELAIINMNRNVA